LSQADGRFYVQQTGDEPQKAILVMMDETDIHLCPDLKTKGLQLRGQQVKVPGPGLDEVCYLFGSTDPFSGQGLYEIYDQKASCQFCFHLEHLMDTFPDYFIFVVADNAPAHRSAATIDFLKAHQDRMEFVPLPTYSPNLNGIERLWRVMRDKLMRSRAYDTLHQKCTAIMNFLRSLSFDRFIDILGVANKVTT
jgi:transposase